MKRAWVRLLAVSIVFGCVSGCDLTADVLIPRTAGPLHSPISTGDPGMVGLLRTSHTAVDDSDPVGFTPKPSVNCCG